MKGKRTAAGTRPGGDSGDASRDGLVQVWPEIAAGDLPLRPSKAFLYGNRPLGTDLLPAGQDVTDHALRDAEAPGGFCLPDLVNELPERLHETERNTGGIALSIPAGMAGGEPSEYRFDMGDRKKPLTADQIAACRRLKRLWESHGDRLGLTQESVGEAIGVSQGAVGNMLHGRLAISLKALLGWMHVLKVGAADIDPIAAEKHPALGGLSTSSTSSIDAIVLEWCLRNAERHIENFMAQSVSQRADMLAQLYDYKVRSSKNPEASHEAVLQLVASRGRR